MMAKSDRLHVGSYYRNAFGTAGDFEGSGSSGRMDMEIPVSEDSSGRMRRSFGLNSNRSVSFGVPTEVIPLSHMSGSERKEWLRRLRIELDQIRVLQKRVELQQGNGVVVPSSNGKTSKKSMPSGSGKKMNPSAKARPVVNRGASGRFERVEPSLTNASNILLMKQCEALLKRMLSHNHAWVFSSPVDPVKLNIPDYFKIIEHPMDLGTIKKKLALGQYSTPLEFAADVRLTFSNAMLYNGKGHDVYVMADVLSKYFEVRWKPVEKKVPKPDGSALPENSDPLQELEITEPSPAKKRKLSTFQPKTMPESSKRVMTDEEKRNLGSDLQSLDLPAHILDFLKEHSSNGGDDGEDEIEIDIDDFSHDALFTLRKLIDDYLLEKQRNQARGEPCEMELLNESGPSNSSMQHHKDNDPADEDVDIGGNEPPVSSYPPVEIKKDAGYRSNKCLSPDSSSDSDSDSSTSSQSDSDDKKTSSPKKAQKVPDALDSQTELENKATVADCEDRNEPVSQLDQPELNLQQKPTSVESDGRQDGESAPSDPERAYRAAVLINRYADTIWKARERTLSQGDRGDPEKLRREREELELQKKKEKARLEAEAKAAEDARKRAEAAAAAEARRQLELEREAARQALLKMEKTVEINGNAQFLEDLEMLRNAPAEHLPSSVDETSPEHTQDGLGGFKFGDGNPLQQLGLFMKDDEEEEEVEGLNFSNPGNEVVADASNTHVSELEEGEAIVDISDNHVNEFEGGEAVVDVSNPENEVVEEGEASDAPHPVDEMEEGEID